MIQKKHLNQRGYFGVVVYLPKTGVNVGTLWRSASIFGASFIATIGRRYKHESSDTMQTPRHVPLLHYLDWEDFKSHIPKGAVTIGVEITEKARDLTDYGHAPQAVYVLGPEDGGLPTRILDDCVSVVQIPGRYCLNVAVAGSIVLYDRIAKANKRNAGLRAA